MLGALVLIAAGYLLGSVSPTYLLGRWLGGKDLRQYGSGSLGGSMVYEHVGRWAVVPVALFDIAKAALPAWLGLRLGLGEGVAVVAGLAAAVGHNWSIFFRLRGGRGMATFVGIWLALWPPGILWLGALLAIGWRLGDSGPWLLASLLTLPLLARLLAGPDIVAPVAGAMILLTLAKRLEANGRPLPPAGPERWKVLLRRAFLDRDVASHEEWIRRKPDSTAD
jgi:glycerol-3-phosphate acyltransferase PlsY